MRKRSKRVHQSEADNRSLSLSEELENLRDGLLALSEDVARVRAGEKHRTNAMRAAIRELITDLGDSYCPALIRVAGHLGLPLPVYALPKGNPMVGLKMAAGYLFEPPHCTRQHATEVLTDFSEWVRRPMFLHESRNSPYTFDKIIAMSANSLGGAHSSGTIPTTIDGMARTNIGGLSANTRFLLRVAEVVDELGQYLLRTAATPEAERCTERRHASHMGDNP